MDEFIQLLQNLASLIGTFFIPEFVVFLVVYLIIRHILKVENRFLNAGITLLACLIITSSMPTILLLVLSSTYVPPILPWSNCCTYNYGHACQSPSNGSEVEIENSLLFVLCKIVQLVQITLTGIAVLFLIVPPAYDKLKKKRHS
jgi:hypothetical protein